MPNGETESTVRRAFFLAMKRLGTSLTLGTMDKPYQLGSVFLDELGRVGLRVTMASGKGELEKRGAAAAEWDKEV